MKLKSVLRLSLLLFTLGLVSCNLFKNAYQEVEVLYRVAVSGIDDTVRVRVTYKDGGGFFNTNESISPGHPWEGDFPAQSGFSCSLTAVSLDGERSVTLTATILIDGDVLETASNSGVECTVTVLGTVP